MQAHKQRDAYIQGAFWPRLGIWLCAFLTAIGLLGLGVAKAGLAAPTTQDTTEFTVETLRNAEYRTQNTPSRTVTLVDGVYEEISSDGVPMLQISLTDDYVFGDLNGDGLNDAAAILATTPPANGQMLELVALINQDGQPVIGGLILLGENVQINSLSIANEEIVVDLSRYAPTDEACCPSLQSTHAYVSRLGLLIPKQTRSFGQLFPFQDGNLYGYVNVLGEMVIEPQFTLAGEFSEGMAPVSYDGNTTGYINQIGELVIAPKFSYGGAFVRGLALVGVPGVDADKPFLTLYIDRLGRSVFGGTGFVSAEPFSEGLAAISYDGQRYGYIDLLGQTVIEPQFSHAESFVEGLAPVAFAGQYGFIDRTGKFVIEPQFEAVEPFHDGRAQIVLGGKTGYINHQGEILVEPVFDYGSNFREGRALVALDGNLAYIDAAGNAEIQLPQMDRGQGFSEGLAAVAINGLYGYIDLQGNFIISPQFTEATDFKNGLAVVQTAEAWRIVNNIGEVVLELPKFTRSTNPATDLVEYLPALPEEVRPGVCSGSSNILGMVNAWRCTTEGQEFDPCLLGEDGATLVCNATPATNNPGFRLELSRPLPEAKSVARFSSILWELRVDDLAICTLASAISLEVDGKPVTYVCDDREVLLGEIDRSGPTWTAEKALLANDGEGVFTIERSKTVNILTAWQPVEQQE